MSAKGGRKSTDISLDQRRVRATEMLLYERLNSLEFRAKASKEFGISERQADDLRLDCMRTIRARFDEEKETILQNHLERYYDLLRRAREDNNKRVEREVLADLNKLYGIETKKVDVTSGGNPINVNIILGDEQ